MLTKKKNMIQKIYKNQLFVSLYTVGFVHLKSFANEVGALTMTLLTDFDP